MNGSADCELSSPLATDEEPPGPLDLSSSILPNDLAYVDVEPAEVGHASVLFTVAQQLSYSMGVAMGAGLLQASAIDGHLTASAFRLPFIIIALFGGLSVFTFIPLRPNAGELARGAR